MCVQARTAGRAFRISLRNCAQPNRTPLARSPCKVRVRRFFACARANTQPWRSLLTSSHGALFGLRQPGGSPLVPSFYRVRLRRLLSCAQVDTPALIPGGPTEFVRSASHRGFAHLWVGVGWGLHKAGRSGILQVYLICLPMLRKRALGPLPFLCPRWGREERHGCRKSR